MTESGRRGKANEISDSRSGFKGMSIEGEKLRWSIGMSCDRVISLGQVKINRESTTCGQLLIRKREKGKGEKIKRQKDRQIVSWRQKETKTENSRSRGEKEEEGEEE